MDDLVARETRRGWYEPAIEEKMALAERHGLDTLLYCKDPWAVRHYWVNKATGERQQARCNRWECQYCGPRKVQLWRQLVEQAGPTLFLTLSKAGKTVEEARRALTTFTQALRRGSKGRGPNHVGARDAYPVEYFAVLERHEDFEQNGFHWHLLLKGVDHIPYKEVIQPLWASATHYRPRTDEDEGQGANIGYIRRVKDHRTVGYVTKYLMKTLSIGERGLKEVKREREVLVQDEQGHMQMEKQAFLEQVTSKAHRICYSRQFFPEQVAVLRKRLFAGIEHDVAGEEANSEPIEEKEASQWVLMERQTEEFVDVNTYKRGRCAELAEELQETPSEDEQVYQRQKQVVAAQIAFEVRSLVNDERRRLQRKVLQEAIEDERPLCRRVISMWAYHRGMLARAG
jgi:hypothetical protein